MMEEKSSRRDFLKMAAGTTTGLTAAAMGFSGCNGNSLVMRRPAELIKSAPLEKIRVGFVGAGGRGSGLIENSLLKIDSFEIKAICDIVPEKVEKNQKAVVDAGYPKPMGYSRGETDFIRMCETEDLDLVVTATPWHWHTPVCVAAMKNGKHAASEVPAACTIDECWQLVETSEKYNRYCAILENCCYMRTEMMLLNMIRKGLFGEVVHCEGGYRHHRGHFDEKANLTWRAERYVTHDNNPYATHPIGPIAWWLDINRGDRFDYLVSMSTASRAINWEAARRFGPDHPAAKRKYALGDINCSMIKTAKGKTVTLYHDTQLPRPYSRINNISAEKGVFNDFCLDQIAGLPYEGLPGKIHIQGRTAKWEPIDNFVKEFEHPVWQGITEGIKQGGHGGGDSLEFYRMAKCFREGKPLDIDVYDAATWSVISPLTEKSVARRSSPVDFPDFTRGKWKTNTPIPIFEA
jgi:predicted dehydrogenase